MWRMTDEECEKHSRWCYTKGVPQKAIELCEVAGENPYTQWIDYGPGWFKYAAAAREALGLKDDDLEPEPSKRHFMSPDG